MRSDRFHLSIADLRTAAAAAARGLLPAYSSEGAIEFVEATHPLARNCSALGEHEILSLGDDLLLTRCDFHSVPEIASQRERWEFDHRGWLMMHFRLDGLSDDETPDGRRWPMGAETFFLSTSSRPLSMAREVLGDTWRTVGIACRPSFVTRHLEIPRDSLPAELRSFRSGDADVDFWFAGRLSEDMKAAVGALLQPRVHSSVRPIYLQAKVIELACLALDRLRMPELTANETIELSSRDIACLQAARRHLDACETAPSLEELGRRVGLNRTKLAAGFKHVFGTTVGAYHRDRRLDLAREMLDKPGMRISQAAMAAGYADMSSFAKAFKARYDALPSDLRRRRGAVKPR